MIDSRTKATAAGLVSRVCADSALATIWSAISDMPPERASLARFGKRLAGRVGRLGQRAEQRQRGNQRRLVRGDLLADDRAHRMADEMRLGDAEAAHGGDHRGGHRVDGQRLERPRRAARARQVDADDAVAAERRQLRLEHVGRAAEAMDHDDGKAVALDFRDQRVRRVTVVMARAP